MLTAWKDKETGKDYSPWTPSEQQRRAEIRALTIEYLNIPGTRNVQVASNVNALELILAAFPGINPEARYTDPPVQNSFEVHPADNDYDLPHVRFLSRGGVVNGHISYGR